jgi:hypothetical protein
MARPVRYPENGAWPAWMRADMAAAFVDERSVEEFLANVKAGVWPRPAIVISQRNKKWRLEDLRKVDRGTGTAQPERLEDDL